MAQGGEKQSEMHCAPSVQFVLVESPLRHGISALAAALVPCHLYWNGEGIYGSWRFPSSNCYVFPFEKRAAQDRLQPSNPWKKTPCKHGAPRSLACELL